MFILQVNHLYFFRLLVRFQKNLTLRVFLNIYIRTPKLTNFLNPQEISQEYFFIYLWLYIYMCIVFNLYQNEKNERTLLVTVQPVPPVTIKHFVKKLIEKLYWFLKGSKDLLTPINGRSINWTPSEILRISLRGIKHFVKKKTWETLLIF